MSFSLRLLSNSFSTAALSVFNCSELPAGFGEAGAGVAAEGLGGAGAAVVGGPKNFDATDPPPIVEGKRKCEGE